MIRTGEEYRETLRDGREVWINGERALFLGGSMHPVRATRVTWEAALDEAVRNGLNMVTILLPTWFSGRARGLDQISVYNFGDLSCFSPCFFEDLLNDPVKSL